MPDSPYRFTSDWFSHNIDIWSALFGDLRPRRVLEIGSYEGRSAVWMAEIMSQFEGGYIDCCDTWEDEYAQRCFHWNIGKASKLFNNVHIMPFKAESSYTLSSKRYDLAEYDLVYIDGSHRACDVLSDAVDSYHLCRKGGVMIFDDYHAGSSNENPLRSPKVAIDAFVNCFADKLELLSMPTLTQIFVRKK